MKKIKAFTLLEMLLVIAIIWIVSVSLLNARSNSWNKTDIWREAVNVIYKEMNQYIKEFQRNKVWDDASGHEHEIQYFYINFNNNSYSTITWKNLIVGNLYTYTWEIDDWNGWTTPIPTWYFEWTTLISNQKYSAFQVLKWSDKYTFYTRNENTWNVTSIAISNNWKIYTWNFENAIEDYEITPENLMDSSIYKFLICWWYWEIKPIWVISINAITKVATLDWCRSERYGGINCDEFALCK